MNRKKKFFKRGSAEILAFCVILPAFVTLMLLVVSIAQFALAQQKVEYVAYSVGRAAVVKDNQTDAERAAERVTRQSLSDGCYINPRCSMDIQNNASWVKGSYLEINVQTEVKTVIGGHFHASSNIYMMIERPIT